MLTFWHWLGLAVITFVLIMLTRDARASARSAEFSAIRARKAVVEARAIRERLKVVTAQRDYLRTIYEEEFREKFKEALRTEKPTILLPTVRNEIPSAGRHRTSDLPTQFIPRVEE